MRGGSESYLGTKLWGKEEKKFLAKSGGGVCATRLSKVGWQRNDVRIFIIIPHQSILDFRHGEERALALSI